MASDDPGREVAYFDRAIDLTNASSAEMTFDSTLSAVASSGRVQASSDGITWDTIGEVPATDDRVSVDLTPFAGRVVYVRFVLSTASPLRRADSWTVENLAVRIR